MSSTNSMGTKSTNCRCTRRPICVAPLWRGTWSEEEKKHWSKQLTVGAKTLKTMREELRTQYQIDFTDDKQMARFRDWIQDELRVLELTEEMKDDERRMEEEFPNATKDEIRDKLLKRTYAKIFSKGDFRLFFKAVHTDVKIDTLNLNREKFKESLRTKIDAGIEMLREAAKDNPVIKAAIKQIREATMPE